MTDVSSDADRSFPALWNADTATADGQNDPEYCLKRSKLEERLDS